MKKHNTIKVVLITMLVFLVLSWILPAAYYSGEYIDQGRVQMGLFDLFNYPLTAVAYFGYIAFYFILVGGFYGILYKIPAYRTFLDKFAGSMKGRESIWLSVMVLVLASLVSICGLQFGIALFIPFIVSLILLMGYDKIVAALVTVGSISVGLLGSTYAYSNIGILTQICSLNWDYQIGVRFVLLFVGAALVIFNTLVYAKHNHMNVKIERKTVKRTEKVAEKVTVSKAEVAPEKVKKEAPKKTSSNGKKPASKKSAPKGKKPAKKSGKNPNKAALKNEDIIVVKESKTDEDLVPTVVASKNKIWPFVLVFSLLFVIFVLAFITWGDNGFKVALFTNITKSVNEFKLFGFPLFAKLLGSFNAFGSWTITDMFLPMALAVLLLAVLYKVKLDDIFEGFANGAKKAFGPALLVIFMYTILVMVTYHPFQLTIYKAILGLTKGFNIATTVLVAVLASFFNSDVAYTFQSVVPYYTSVITNVDNYSIPAIIFQSVYGLTMLVAPTSLALMAILSYLGVSYKEWLKSVWKLLLELFVVLLIVFIILALI